MGPIITARVVVHGAELDDPEGLAALAVARPAVESRPGRLAAHAPGEDGQQRREQNQPQRRAEQVEQALGQVGEVAGMEERRFSCG